MAKRMEAITVEADQNGMIRISQDDYGNGESLVIISPDQVDILCQWLKEEQENINKKINPEKNG